nr:ribokinase [Quercus suber]
MSAQHISVIGSLNVDFITRTPRLPSAGETLTATSFTTGFGGKGANQAVACARLAPPGIKVSMVGNVGNDTFGSDYLSALKKEGIDASRVRRLEDVETGVANIIVEESSGENRIMLATGANYGFAEKRDEGWELVGEDGEGVVVLQLEIPMAVASQGGKHVIMNPAPAVRLPDTIFPFIDTLVMNETESKILAGDVGERMTPLELAEWFLTKGVRDAVIVTLGGQGLVYATTTGTTGTVPAEEVEVVDTTAAGDTFVGAYAVERARVEKRYFGYREALVRATLAASKTVGRKGAMAAIPYLNEM